MRTVFLHNPMPETVVCPFCGIRIVLLDGLDVAGDFPAPPLVSRSTRQRRDDWVRDRTGGMTAKQWAWVLGRAPSFLPKEDVDAAEGRALVAAALSRVRDASDVLHELAGNALAEKWLGILADRVVAAQTVLACERAS